jgi:hypothetical protein
VSVSALFITLLRNLPTILAIIEHLDRMAKEQATEKKVDQSLKEIEDAFRSGDAEKLRSVLNSR